MSRSRSAALVAFVTLAAAGCGSELDVPCGAAAAQASCADADPADVVDADSGGDADADDSTSDDVTAPADDEPEADGADANGSNDDTAADDKVGDDAADDAADDDAVADDAVADGAVADGADNDIVAADADAGDPRFNIRFATYNVRTSNLDNRAWGDAHVGWDANDAARMARVASTIASQHLTVVALQEVRRPERTAIVDALLDEHRQAWRATTQSGGADDTVVIFRRSVWKKIKETHFVIPLQPGLNDRAQIGVLLEHKATGERVWFYSVHLAAAGSAGESARRIGIRRTVTSIETHAVDHGQRFVLGGDFNTDASGAVGDVLRAAGFAKNTRSAADQIVNNGCATFNSRAGSAGNQTCPGGAARHIDQVWVSRSGLHVLKVQVTANALTSRSSDHNPLTTILQTR